MGKQFAIGDYCPHAFLDNKEIVSLYAAKREFKRKDILAQRQGDAWSVMEYTKEIMSIDAKLVELQTPKA